jgi:hypothetical protein
MLHRVVWQILTDVSEELTASTKKVIFFFYREKTNVMVAGTCVVG